MAELANDYVGYLPDKKAHELGGYQTWTGLHSFAAPGTGERVVDAAIQIVADLSRTTDQDTTHLYLRGYDKYGNSARFVGGSWGLTGAIGSAAPPNGVGTVLTLTSLGSGFATADSGAWSDSTGAITVTHGARNLSQRPAPWAVGTRAGRP